MLADTARSRRLGSLEYDHRLRLLDRHVLVGPWSSSRCGWLVSMNRDRPVEYDDIAEHFKYGSIGSEPGGSLLRPVGGRSAALLDVQGAPVHLPREAARRATPRLGLITEPGKDLPIGVSTPDRFGVDQVGFNCALCHTGTVRDAPGAPPAHRPGHARRTSSICRRLVSSCWSARWTAG